MSLAVLTMLGAHGRGDRWALPFLEGLVFPMTWTAWYIRDELPPAPVSQQP